MKKIFESVKNNLLFKGIDYNDFERIAHCIEARTQSYKKDDVVLLAGSKINSVGLIVSGSVKIIKEDVSGNASILTELSAPGLFGEVFACAGINHSPVTVQTSEKSEILFINYKKIISVCSSACSFHSQIIQNMLQLIAGKNLVLNQKIEIISKRTTREKLLAFFDTQRGTAKNFTVPYNREGMASYLCIDRSALSKELCKMRDEGIIRFRKNNFEIL